MFSAWGKSWACAWGDSWGPCKTGGGGPSSKKKKRRKFTGWANERARFDQSQRRPEPIAPTIEKTEEKVYSLSEFEYTKMLEEALSLQQAISDTTTRLEDQELSVISDTKADQEELEVLLMALSLDSRALISII